MKANDLNRLMMLALCVWREARGESVYGKLLVAGTVRNRVEDARWPDTYADVVTQKLQFSAFNVGDPNAVKFPAEDSPEWADCVAAAEMVLDAENNVTMANHYHATSVKPSWADDTKVVAREGAHVFYCL